METKTINDDYRKISINDHYNGQNSVKRTRYDVLCANMKESEETNDSYKLVSKKTINDKNSVSLKEETSSFPTFRRVSKKNLANVVMPYGSISLN